MRRRARPQRRHDAQTVGVKTKQVELCHPAQARPHQVVAVQVFVYVEGHVAVLDFLYQMPIEESREMRLAAFVLIKPAVQQCHRVLRREGLETLHKPNIKAV